MKKELAADKPKKRRWRDERPNYAGKRNNKVVDKKVSKNWQDTPRDERPKFKSQWREKLGIKKVGDPKSTTQVPTNSPKEKLPKEFLKFLKDTQGVPWFATLLSENDGAKCIQQKVSGVGHAVKLVKLRGGEIASQLSQLQSQSSQWLDKAAGEGTARDKTAALTLQIQECPIRFWQHLELLLKSATKPSPNAASLPLECLKDLLTQCLLPDDRKLYFLGNNPNFELLISNGTLTATYSQVAWLWFEDFLKSTVAQFVQLLNVAAHDSVGFWKNKAIDFAFEMLASRPEQEVALLELLVDKMGDKLDKTAANSVRQLRRLIELHPTMTIIVIKAMTNSISRCGVIVTLKRYVTFLAEIQLKRDDEECALTIIKCFMQFFSLLMDPTPFDQNSTGRELLRGQAMSESCAGLLKALLTGIRRALPFVSQDEIQKFQLGREVDELFRMGHIIPIASNRITVVALLLALLSHHSLGLSERFYRLVYELSLNAETLQASNRELFLKVILDLTIADPIAVRASAMLRRAFSACLHVDPPSMAVRAAEVLAAVCSVRSDIRGMLEVRTDESRLAADDVEEEFEDFEGSDEEMESQKRKLEKSKNENENEKQKVLTYGGFDPFKREPKFSNSFNTNFWELKLGQVTCHPTVAFASRRIASLDGLETLSSDLIKSHPILCPENLTPRDIFSQSYVLNQLGRRALRLGRALSKGELSVAESKWWELRGCQVPPHEEFLEKYYMDPIVARKRRRHEAPEMAESEEEEVDRFLERDMDVGIDPEDDDDGPEDDDDVPEDDDDVPEDDDDVPEDDEGVPEEMVEATDETFNGFDENDDEEKKPKKVKKSKRKSNFVPAESFVFV